jgi:hypothetical protein
MSTATKPAQIKGQEQIPAPYLKLYNGNRPMVGDTVYRVDYADLRAPREATVGSENNTVHSEYFATYTEAVDFIKNEIGEPGFMIGSEFFYGDLNIIMSKYKSLNPSKPWRIWLIDNGYRK